MIVGAVIVGSLALALVGIGVVGALFWLGTDGGNARKSDVMALRKSCGIDGPAFEHAASATGSGFQEHEYDYVYRALPGAWVDANVLRRFGEELTTAERPLLDEPADRGYAQVSLGAPPLVFDSGRLIYSSPIARSEMGTTTFDVYRSWAAPERYSVRIVCKNEAGINYVPDEGVVTTTVP